MENEIGFIERANMDLINKIQTEKEAVLLKRINQRVPNEFLSIDFKKEALRTFPRIACVKSFDTKSEHYYWNDGTEEGLHIVSFIHEETPFKWSDANSYNFKIEIKYSIK